MTYEEYIYKYIKECCSNCVNQDTDLCEIHIFVLDRVIKTKCSNYERRKE